MSLDTLVGDKDATAGEHEAIIAAWTGETPEPGCWIEAPGFVEARREIVDALSCGAGSVVLTGPSGHGKSLLLRTLWQQPPSGFAPILVPFADVEAAQIAAWILSTTRTGPIHDAENALKRLLITHDRRRARPLFLIDELQSMPPATLSHLLGLASAAGVEVELVAAGLESTPLHAVARLLPSAPRWIAVNAPWSSADAERLLVRLAGSLQIDVVALLASIDLDALIRASSGNPRLVRNAIAAHLRRLDLTQLDIASAKEPPLKVPPTAPSVAIPEPAPLVPEPEIALEEEAGHPEPEPAPASRPLSAPVAIALPPSFAPAPPVPPQRTPAPHVYVPRTALVATPSASPPLPPQPPTSSKAPPPRTGRSRTRPQRRFSVARLGVSLSAAIAACAAIALAVDRAPALFASTWAIVSVLGAEKLDRARDWAQREVPVDGLYRARDWVQREIGSARAAWTASAGVPVVVAAADPPILVSVNSDPWSNVEVDGLAAGTTPLTIELLPGPHAFRAELADGRVLEQVVHVSPDLDRISFR